VIRTLHPPRPLFDPRRKSPGAGRTVELHKSGEDQIDTDPNRSTVFYGGMD
jgi:hypothetical protein